MESSRPINQAIKKRSKTTKIDMFKELGSDIFIKQEIANTMNDYFCSVGKGLASKIEAVPNLMVTGKCNLYCYHFRTIRVQDMREVMVEIKTSNSFGSDKMSSYFSKLEIPFIERSLVLFSILLLKLAIFQTCGKKLALRPFLRMEIGLKSYITAQSQFSL